LRNRVAPADPPGRPWGHHHLAGGPAPFRRSPLQLDSVYAHTTVVSSLSEATTVRLAEVAASVRRSACRGLSYATLTELDELDQPTAGCYQDSPCAERLAVLRHELAGDEGRAGRIGEDGKAHPRPILRLGED